MYKRQDLVKYVDVGATYYFNKNMSTFVDYKINLIDDSKFNKTAGIDTDDIVAVGPVSYTHLAPDKNQNVPVADE